MNRSAEWDDRIARAKAVDIANVVAARGGLGLKKRRTELVGACPHCGGTDRFSVCTKSGKQVFNCRGCGAKGDAIALVQFLDSCDFARAVETLTGEQPPEAKPKTNGHGDKLGRIVATYDYTDEADELLFQVVRFDPKTFRQRRPDGKGGWIWGLNSTRMVPFHLPQLIEAVASERPIIIVEGEKDVLTAESLGLVATTNPGGAGKWRAEYDQHFTGTDVIIVPDNDAAGAAHAQEIATHLRKVARRARTVTLPAKDLSLWVESGGTREQFDKLVDNGPEPKEQSAKEPRFKLRPFASLVFKCTSTYLVKELIPLEGLVVIWGPPKCGKSFWTFDLTMHMAMGRHDYRGRRVKQTPVVYCAFEGEAGFVNRKEAFLRRNDDVPGDVPFFIVGTHMDMAKEHRVLINDIRTQIGETLPGVVVLDTLNRSLGGSENKDEDMAAYVKAADAIREAFHCVVIIIHHCGVDGSRPRGHSSLTGAADAQLAVKKDAMRNVVVTVEYMKDGQEGDIIVSRLERVFLGLNEDGDEISSCVIVPHDDAAVTRQTVKLTKNQQTLLTILRGAGKAGLENEEWYAAARELGIATKRKADFYDNRRALEEKRIVVKQNDGRWYVLEIAAQPIGGAA